MYNVVFQYNKKAGAYYGVRTWTSFKNKEELQKMRPPSEDSIEGVLAEDVTEEVAISLTAQTPEICHLMVAIQEMCYREDGTVDLKLAPYQVNKAIMGIIMDRSTRDENGVSANRNIPDFEIGEEDTEKNKLLRHIKETYSNSPGGNLGLLSLVKIIFDMHLGIIALQR